MIMRRRPSIRRQAIFLFLLTLAPVFLTSTILSFSTREVQATANSLFETNVYFDNMKSMLGSASTSLGAYLTTSDSDELRSYLFAATSLRDLGEAMPESFASIEGLVRRKNILSMTGRYLLMGDAAVAARRGRFVERYTSFYSQVLEIAQLINDGIDELNQHELKENIDRYLRFSEAFAKQQLWGSLIIACSAILSIFLISLTSLQISRPIMTLAKGADEIAKGNFNIPDFRVRSSREVERLGETYNSMKAAINDYIEQIKEKGEIEKGLVEQKLDNMRMQNVLRIAEIQALQAQINPHFLFNTLNTGVQLAVVEGADRTVAFLEHLSDVYRYNIRHFNKICTLDEELKVLESYIYVINIRFADRFRFVQEIEDNCLDLRLPSMILQPLVENAVVHGLREKDSGGLISIRARALVPGSEEATAHGIQDAAVELVISDNGKGIDTRNVDRILHQDALDYEDQERTEESTGIGVRNVLQRLRLFFRHDDIMRIESQQGRGTVLSLVLPREAKAHGFGTDHHR